MHIDDFVSRLRKVKRCGENKYMACCPAHDDKNPSLSITAAPNGNLLLHCWTGCSAAEVVQSLGLSLRDLFANPLDYEPPMAFAQREMRQKSAQAVSVEQARLILALGYADRKGGKRLSAQDMASERQAFELLRRAGVEASPEVCYYAVLHG